MWGVEPIAKVAGIGCSWLLGTDAITAHPLVFWRVCKAELAKMLKAWRVLLNWIAADYEKSLRWARGLGFTVEEPAPFGPDGDLFCCASIVRR
jgi:hypothetical protein